MWKYAEKVGKYSKSGNIFKMLENSQIIGNILNKLENTQKNWKYPVKVGKY